MRRAAETLHKAERRLNLRSRWFSIVVLATVIGFTGAFTGFLAFFTVRSGWATAADIADDYLCDPRAQTLQFDQLAATSEIYILNGDNYELLSKLRDFENRYYVELENIPENFINAVLAAEDASFYEHEGLDFRAVARALIADIKSASTQQGGSTITQQLVKTNFLDDEQTIKRKVCEAQISIELERRFTKDEILERYLNQVYFGHSAYGVAAAAEVFYGRAMDQLTPAETAVLASAIRAPTRYSPFLNPDTARERRDQVLRQMEEHGWITAGELNDSLLTGITVEAQPNTFDYGSNDAPHFEAFVRDALLNSEEFTEALGSAPGSDERKADVFGGGLRVFTTLDLELQQAALDVLHARLDGVYQPCDLEASGQCFLDGALANIEVENGAIRALASTVEWSVDAYDPASQGLRNPGSTFKIFTMVAALSTGFGTDTCYNAKSPVEIDIGGGNTWRVSGGAGGPTTLRAGTRGSINTYFAQLIMDVGPDVVGHYAEQMGITSPLYEVGEDGQHYYPPALTLGARAVTPLEMAAAVSVLPRGGVRLPPYAIERIEDAAGNLIFEHAPEGEQILTPAVARVGTELMEAVITGGTGTRANIEGWEDAGKTGTHQSYRDAWFVGFTQLYTTAVWMGYREEQLAMRNVSGPGINYGTIFGGEIPAPIWHDFMQAEIDILGLAPVPFREHPPESEDLYNAAKGGSKAEVPDFVGLNYETAAAQIVELAETLSVSVEYVHSDKPKGEIIGQSPPPGGNVQGCSFGVTLQVSDGILPTTFTPSVIGMTWAEAVATLAASTLGAAGGCFVDVADPAQDGRVVTQSTPAGSELNSDTVVTLCFGRFVPTADTTEPPPTVPPPPVDTTTTTLPPATTLPPPVETTTTTLPPTTTTAPVESSTTAPTTTTTAPPGP